MAGRGRGVESGYFLPFSLPVSFVNAVFDSENLSRVYFPDWAIGCLLLHGMGLWDVGLPATS